MKKQFLVISLILLFSCQKYRMGKRDNNFRNSFVGKWHIDSFIKESYIIDSMYRDTKESILTGVGAHIIITETKDQINKNTVCSGLFRDSAFKFEVQGFADKRAERLAFQSCSQCNDPGEVFIKYLINVYYIIFHKDGKLILKSKWWVNGKEKGNTLFLTRNP